MVAAGKRPSTPSPGTAYDWAIVTGGAPRRVEGVRLLGSPLYNTCACKRDRGGGCTGTVCWQNFDCDRLAHRA